MRVFIAGIDGYLGWALAGHLAKSGHTVAGLDCLARRVWVREAGSTSAIPIAGQTDRMCAFSEDFGQDLFFSNANMTDYDSLVRVLEVFAPDAIVHLAEQPSAPYSMIGRKQAAQTQSWNTVGSLNLLWAMKEVCPEAQLVKLGTMGEYGTPNCPIPEGFFPDGTSSNWLQDKEPHSYDLSGMWFPRVPGSFYHLTKVFDSHNVWFACKAWGLRSTDIMQGPVYGTYIDSMGDDPRMRTRFDFDEVFGTVINRFCAQAIAGHPLTVYGTGEQTRAFLPLTDSMRCIQLILENPPSQGEYRVFNQFERSYSMNELAANVSKAADKAGFHASIQHYENPRMEAPKHFYQPDNSGLLALGYEPTTEMIPVLVGMLLDLSQPEAVKRIKRAWKAIPPYTRWDTQHRAHGVLRKHPVDADIAEK